MFLDRETRAGGAADCPRGACIGPRTRASFLDGRSERAVGSVSAWPRVGGSVRADSLVRRRGAGRGGRHRKEEEGRGGRAG